MSVVNGKDVPLPSTLTESNHELVWTAPLDKITSYLAVTFIVIPRLRSV